MARIPYPEASDLEENIRKYLPREQGLNILKMMCRAGNIVDRFSKLGFGLLVETTLDPVLRELAILRVGHASGAAYEITHHERIIRRMGVGEEKIRAIGEDPTSDLFSDTEQLVLTITDEVIHTVKMSDDHFKKIHEVLSYREVMELVMTIEYYMMACRFLENYEIDMEEPHKG